MYAVRLFKDLLVAVMSLKINFTTDKSMVSAVEQQLFVSSNQLVY